MTRSQCTKVWGGASRGSSACMDRWIGHAKNVGGGDSRCSSTHMDKWTGHAKKVRGGDSWGSNACKDRWIGHVGTKEVEGMWSRHAEQANGRGRTWSGQMESPIDQCATMTNSPSVGFIMILDVQEYRPSTLVGTQKLKALK
jgi:hypothetical protein